MRQRVEIVYVDGLVEVFDIPVGLAVHVEPTVLVIGEVNIERRMVRRWRVTVHNEEQP